LEASTLLARGLSTRVENLAQDTLELRGVVSIHCEAKDFERGMKTFCFGQFEIDG